MGGSPCILSRADWWEAKLALIWPSVDELLIGMPFEWRIKSLRFSGGEEVSLEPASVLVLIGPNSAGKSTALRNVENLLRGNAGPGHLVVREASVEKSGSEDEFERWLRSSYATTEINGQEHFVTTGTNLSASLPRQLWSAPHAAGLSQAFPFLVHRIDGQNRLTMANYTSSIGVYRQPPAAYVHMLQANPRLAEEISSIVLNSFGVDLVIDWLAGGQVGFRVGKKPTSESVLSPAFDRELNALPRLEQEGDGIRSFVGLLLAAKCGAHPVLLIDEPEAFLHPSQAQRLAKKLSNSASQSRRQVIIATHSADIVQGALAGGRVAVCRITRDGAQNHAALLDSAALTALWSKPLLRSVSTITGLFHEGVIVAEAHADARFYEAIFRRLVDDSVFGRSPGFYFASGSGKGDLATLAAAYTKLKTRVAVIADLDLLRNAAELAAVLDALGHSPSECSDLYNPVISALAKLGPSMDSARFCETLKSIQERVRSSGKVTEPDRKELEPLLRASADWAEAKRYGLAKLRGGALENAEQLLERLRSWGLFLVPKGELEGWWTQGPAEKRAWAAEAIPKIAEDPGPFRDAIHFMTGVCRWLGAELST